MPITSYLAHPHPGRKEELMKSLSSMAHCDVIPAENEELLILVTETETKLEEDNLRSALDNIGSIKLLAMVSGFETSEND